MVSNHVYHTQQAPVGQHPVGNGRLDLTPVTVEVPLASVAPSGVRVPLDDCLLREMAQQPYRLERQKQLLLLDLARECNATETKKGKIADAARLLHTRSLREVSLAVFYGDENLTVHPHPNRKLSVFQDLREHHANADCVFVVQGSERHLTHHESRGITVQTRAWQIPAIFPTTRHRAFCLQQNAYSFGSSS